MTMTNKEKAEWTYKELAKRRKAADIEATSYQVNNTNRVKRRIR